MNLKEEFMKITTYEEWDKRRYEFKALDMSDEEVRKHFGDLYPKLEHSGYENGVIVEAYPKPKKNVDEKNRTGN